jgi:hypothetical protein
MYPSRGLDIVLLVSNSLVFAEPGLVPLVTVSKAKNRVYKDVFYKNKTAHHVHAGANAGVEADLVGGNHPLAPGL